ncbi:MAG: YihA family ribosome biogenesis GTP-binding protein [Acholeplasmataceae bacterium]|nr:YihA family ribosome biogenesis GTP-binding protein [Acholeplasmataceae bacterium]
MIKTAEYIKGLTDLKDEPEAKPQILLLGRSNVGKSSFINSLTNRKNLARISNTPGKTLILNFYLLNDTFYLVDAPGYGYAKRSKSMQDEFVIILENYLLHSRNLKFVCLLIDFKVGPTKDDLATYEFLKSLHKDIVIVATKKDKINKTLQKKQEKVIREILGDPKVLIAISNQTKENIKVVSDLFESMVEEN